MGQLCIYLTPFASDYSGACSALFDLDCITAINDAGCCTSHYVYYDEPRWNDKVRPVFSTAIRNIDSILGNDDKIINVICEAASKIDNEMIAVIGTPVPALTGMDMDGIAAEIEFRTGKPAFGFNTTGFDYYDKGIYEAGRALIDRFAVPLEIVLGRVNICGMTPLDFGNCGNDKLIEQELEKEGFEIGCRFFMGITRTQIENCASAELNIVVSSAGLKIAKYLKKKFGMPYRVGFPFGENSSKKIADSIKKIECKADKRMLIIADQVIGNSLRAELEKNGYDPEKMTVATFFGFDSGIAQAQDIHFKEEAEYLSLLKEGRFDVLIGDPHIINIPPTESLEKIQVVHPAVSSELGWNEAELLDGRFVDRIMEQIQNINSGEKNGI